MSQQIQLFSEDIYFVDNLFAIGFYNFRGFHVTEVNSNGKLKLAIHLQLQISVLDRTGQPISATCD